MTRQAWLRTWCALVEAAVLWVLGLHAAALVDVVLLASIEPRRALKLARLLPPSATGQARVGTAGPSASRPHAKAGAHR